MRSIPHSLVAYDQPARGSEKEYIPFLPGFKSWERQLLFVRSASQSWVY